MTFQYQTLSPEGKRQSGNVEAADEYAAVARLRESGVVVTKIVPLRRREGAAARQATGKISEQALAILCAQFAVILNSGLPMVRAVALIAGQTADKHLKQILSHVAQDVAAGFTLAHSLQSRGKQLPITLIETIRSGEESGTLDTAFRRLETYYERSHQRKSKVKTAMIYPAFTLVVALIVIGIIMVVAVPAFTSSFSSLGAELPWITQALIAVSDFTVTAWPLLLLGILGIFLAMRMYGGSERGRLTLARRQLGLPILGKITLMKVSAQFANTLSTLLSAGLPVTRAVHITSSILDNAWVRASIVRELPRLEEGRTLVACLRSAKVLPEMLCEMAGIGEETGALEDTLRMVGTYYDGETDVASKRALSLLEPVLITVLALIVMVVLLSVYLPMFSMYSSL